MKRVFLLFLFIILVITTSDATANAGWLSDRKIEQAQKQAIKETQKEIISLFNTQSDYAKKYDIENLKTLYSDKFVDNDGYNKDVYFSLIKDTWTTYPDITYTTNIKHINLNGEYAAVETEETAIATSDDLDRHIIGELNSKSKCIYHLQKVANVWKITSENVIDEISTLKYGDARYLKMELQAPHIIGAGQEYTSTLKVEVPENSAIVASINQERIVNPATKPEEHFMPLREDNTLSRIFNANKDNVNEYNVASLGLTQNITTPEGEVKIIMSGLAFIMARVNVIPINNFARVDDKNSGEDN